MSLTLNRIARHAATSASYEPLIVTPVMSDRKPGQVIAFIGRQLCFFDSSIPAPAVGEPIEVMVLKALYHRGAHDMFDKDRSLAIVIRPVTADDMLISHGGFECSGSMCSTTAMGMIDGKPVMLTPGRTGIYEADNVSPKFYGRDYEEPTPGKAWIKTSDRFRRPIRIEGLARLEDASYWAAVRK